MSATPHDLNDDQSGHKGGEVDPQGLLKQWAAAVAKALKDAANLDVSTFTGTATGIFVPKGGDSFTFDMTKLNDAIGKDVVSLVAHTHIAIDQDQLIFVSEGLNDERTKLLEAHNAAVKAATEARLAFAKAVAELIHFKL